MTAVTGSSGKKRARESTAGKVAQDVGRIRRERGAAGANGSVVWRYPLVEQVTDGPSADGIRCNLSSAEYKAGICIDRDNRYKITGYLGSGAFSSVYQTYDRKDGCFKAVKIMNRFPAVVAHALLASSNMSDDQILQYDNHYNDYCEALSAQKQSFMKALIGEESTLKNVARTEPEAHGIHVVGVSDCFTSKPIGPPRPPKVSENGTVVEEVNISLPAYNDPSRQSYREKPVAETAHLGGGSSSTRHDHDEEDTFYSEHEALDVVSRALKAKNEAAAQRAFSHRCFVMPLYGKNLLQLMDSAINAAGCLPVQFSYSAVLQVYRALRHLNSVSYAHTDIKPENIMLVKPDVGYNDMNELSSTEGNNSRLSDEGRSTGAKRSSGQLVRRSSSGGLTAVMNGTASVALGDLGCCIQYRPGQRYSGVVTTQHYRAPEVMLGIGWDYAVDYWALGCILFELLTGSVLFPRMECDPLQLLAIEVLLQRAGEKKEAVYPAWMVKAAESVAIAKYFDKHAPGRLLADSLLRDHLSSVSTRTAVTLFATDDESALERRFMDRSAVHHLTTESAEFSFIKAALTVDPRRRLEAIEAVVE